MADLIDRQAAIDALDKTCDNVCQYSKKQRAVMCGACPLGSAFDVIEELPSAQPEQTDMIKEIREWINSGNRGNADYFIVDKIEEIINKYER